MNRHEFGGTLATIHKEFPVIKHVYKLRSAEAVILDPQEICHVHP